MTDERIRVRREAPMQTAQYRNDIGDLNFAATTEWNLDVVSFERQALLDLKAGRHASGCQCVRAADIQYADGTGDWQSWGPINACSTIAVCALELKSYDVEVGDAGADS